MEGVAIKTEAVASSEDQFDRCSTSSSLEIVDALTEAVEDTMVDREESPALSALSCPDLVVVNSTEMDGFEDAMTQSQFAQVIFDEIEDSYTTSCDLVCSYSLTPGLEQGHGDRIGLYRLPFLQPHESVCYVWAGVGPQTEQKVTFPKSKLPCVEDFYQFQYLRGDNSVAGASIPFQLKVEPSGDRSGLKEQLGGLQAKYSGLLHLSEKLSEQLNNKTQSFVILEQENKSLCETASRAQQLETDLEELVASSLGLKQTLRATEEALAKTESVLEATTKRLVETELSFQTKSEEASRLEARLVEMGDIREKRDKLAAMLKQEQTSKEGWLKEKAELLQRVGELQTRLDQQGVLLGRIEDGDAMLAAAVKSKEAAVEEIRFQVTKNDELMTRLDDMKKDLEKFDTMKKECNDVAKQIELQQMELNGKNMEILEKDATISSMAREQAETQQKMKVLVDELTMIREKEIKEKMKQIEEKQGRTQDDTKLEVHEKEKKQLAAKVEFLEKENNELKARLETGEKHYRKVAKEKLKLEKLLLSTEESKGTKQDVSPPPAAPKSFNSEMSQQTSGDSSLSRTGDSSFSSFNNMDSIKIGEALQVETNPFNRLHSADDPAVGGVPFTASLFQPIPGSQARLPPPMVPLPPPMAPILPETNHCDMSPVPELRPREPAPYSGGHGDSEDGTTGGLQTGQERHQQGNEEEMQCPWCIKSFPAAGPELETHVEQHLAEVLDCPICSKMFEKKNQREFEEHVQGHFQEQEGSLIDVMGSIRDWDLGID